MSSEEVVTDEPLPLTDEQRASIDKALPESIEKVFIVHCGSQTDPKTNETYLRNEVCSRLSETEAQSVADALNAAQERVLQMVWAASKCFPLIQGSGEDLLEAVDDPEVQAAWKSFFDEQRRPIYMVTGVRIVSESERAQLASTLRQASDELQRADEDE